MTALQPFTEEELARRRRKAVRVAWIIGGAVVLIYGLGFLIQR